MQGGGKALPRHCHANTAPAHSSSFFQPVKRSDGRRPGFLQGRVTILGRLSVRGRTFGRGAFPNPAARAAVYGRAGIATGACGGVPFAAGGGGGASGLLRVDDVRAHRRAGGSGRRHGSCGARRTAVTLRPP
eukprot:scaffold12211_cov116-Isochrysis_galbana.AAC.10